MAGGVGLTSWQNSRHFRHMQEDGIQSNCGVQSIIIIYDPWTSIMLWEAACWGQPVLRKSRSIGCWDSQANRMNAEMISATERPSGLINMINCRLKNSSLIGCFVSSKGLRIMVLTILWTYSSPSQFEGIYNCESIILIWGLNSVYDRMCRSGNAPRKA